MPVRELRIIRRWGCLAILIGVLGATPVAPVSAQTVVETRTPQYRLVSLADATPPGYLLFDAVAITDDRRVYGTGYRCDDSACYPSVIVYRAGIETVLTDGVTYAVNSSGVVGGSLLIDPATGAEQAAILTGSHARVMPRLRGETTSHVIAVTSSGTALVSSLNEATVPVTSTYYLHDVRGKVRLLDFGPGDVTHLSINDDGIIAGTIDRPEAPMRAFRYDVRSSAMTLLNPIHADPESQGQGIDRRGDVLGYSYTAGGLERIGVWRGKLFQTYFVEGTPEFPTISNNVLWNRHGLIVITDSRLDPNSYLVPRPGVRLKLADLTDGLPVWTLVNGINARGDLIGFAGPSRGNVDFEFLLERVR